MTTWIGVLLDVFAVIIVVLVGMLADVHHRYRAALRGLDDLMIRYRALEERDRKNTLAATKLLLNIAPLIEKTDWMTGRWGGQFQALVAMENKRNEAVEQVRRSLLTQPGIDDFSRAHGVDLFKGAVTGAAKEILG